MAENSPKVKKAIEAAMDKLAAMSRKELLMELNKPIEPNSIDAGLAYAINPNRYSKKKSKPSKPKIDTILYNEDGFHECVSFDDNTTFPAMDAVSHAAYCLRFNPTALNSKDMLNVAAMLSVLIEMIKGTNEKTLNLKRKMKLTERDLK